MQCWTPGINPSSLTLRGGRRPTSILTSLSFHCSLFPSSLEKDRLDGGKRAKKRGSLASLSLRSSPAHFAGFPADEENNYCNDTSNDAVIRMLNGGVLQCREPLPHLTHKTMLFPRMVKTVQYSGIHMDTDKCTHAAAGVI